MKKTYVIGSHEKSDLLLSTAKVLGEAQRVLIVDATMNQKYQHLVPRIDDEPGITTYDGFDVFVGTTDDLKKEKLGSYDHVIYDLDDPGWLPPYRSLYRFIFTSTMEKPAIIEGHELMLDLTDGLSPEKANIHQLLIQNAKLPGEAYINEQLSDCPITWVSTHTHQPDERDTLVRIHNQYSGKWSMKKLSKDFELTTRHLVDLIGQYSGKESATLYKQAQRRN